MGKNKLQASLIIPTFNKDYRLKLTLESLKKLKGKGSFEVIIVNDGSSDDTQRLLTAFKDEISLTGLFDLQIISTVNQGRSCARNEGVKAARGNVLIFTDDDLILDESFVLNHINLHSDSNELIVHGQILSLPYLKFFKNPMIGEQYDGNIAKGKMLQYCITTDMFLDDRLDIYLSKYAKVSKFEKDIMGLYDNTTLEDSYLRWIGFTGGNISILKENLMSVQLFDSNMGQVWGCEDLEVGYRLYQEGFKFEYSKTSKNYHLNHFRQDFNEDHKKALHYFIRKHQDESITLLEKYFEGEYKSLLNWKDSVNKVRVTQRKGKGKDGYV